MSMPTTVLAGGFAEGCSVGFGGRAGRVRVVSFFSGGSCTRIESGRLVSGGGGVSVDAASLVLIQNTAAATATSASTPPPNVRRDTGMGRLTFGGRGGGGGGATTSTGTSTATPSQLTRTLALPVVSARRRPDVTSMTLLSLTAQFTSRSFRTRPA